jgi:hypothetical protein
LALDGHQHHGFGELARGATDLRIAIICILSSIAATAASLTLLFISYSLFLHQNVSGEDLTGVAIFSFVPSLLMSTLLYTPGLDWIWKKRRECGPAKLYVVVCALILNLPAFMVLGYSAATGGLFGEGEAWYFVAAYIVGGIVYGMGYVWHCRRKAV